MTTRYATLAINTMLSKPELTQMLAASADKAGGRVFYPKRDQKDKGVDFVIEVPNASYAVKHSVSPQTGQTIIRVEDATSFNPKATADAFLESMAKATNGELTAFVQDEALEGVESLNPSDATEHVRAFETEEGLTFLKERVHVDHFEKLAHEISDEAESHLTHYVDDLLKKIGGNGNDMSEASELTGEFVSSLFAMIGNICARNETHVRQSIPNDQLSQIKEVHAIKPSDYTP